MYLNNKIVLVFCFLFLLFAGIAAYWYETAMFYRKGYERARIKYEVRFNNLKEYVKRECNL